MEYGLSSKSSLDDVLYLREHIVAEFLEHAKETRALKIVTMKKIRRAIDDHGDLMRILDPTTPRLLSSAVLNELFIKWEHPHSTGSSREDNKPYDNDSMVVSRATPAVFALSAEMRQTKTELQEKIGLYRKKRKELHADIGSLEEIESIVSDLDGQVKEAKEYRRKLIKDEDLLDEKLTQAEKEYAIALERLAVYSLRHTSSVN
ncbi:hypothetical protein BC829DRAFT_180592 [Chytridium lagenaria]|nr:hypothetical protein BC829DRAFT_180592 [Chytridium lagenaria]